LPPHTSSAMANYPAELPYIDRDPYTKRWTQGGVPKRNSFKPRKYWARPVDGKRRGAMGRLKDALTWEGPDVFVVLNGDPHTFHRDRPHRAQWSGWDGPYWDPRWWDRALGEDPNMTWNQDRHGARPGPWGAHQPGVYNFRTRKYEKGEKLKRDMNKPAKVWMDAQWREGARDREKVPLSSQTVDGQWHSRVPMWSAAYPGGRWGDFY